MLGGRFGEMSDFAVVQLLQLLPDPIYAKAHQIISLIYQAIIFSCFPEIAEINLSPLSTDRSLELIQTLSDSSDKTALPAWVDLTNNIESVSAFPDGKFVIPPLDSASRKIEIESLIEKVQPDVYAAAFITLKSDAHFINGVKVTSASLCLQLDLVFAD